MGNDTSINETWRGDLAGGQESSVPERFIDHRIKPGEHMIKQLRKTVKCEVSYSAKPFAEVSPGVIDLMKMTLVER